MGKVLRFLTVVVLLVVLSASSVLAGGVIKVGADLGGKMKIKTKLEGITLGQVTLDTKMGFLVAGEYFSELSDGIAIGAGVEYQLNRGLEDYDEFKYNYIPFYILARYQIDPSIYLTGKVGYNIFQVQDLVETVDIKGGIFYGIGGGVLLDDMWQLEVLYSVHNSVLEGPVYLMESDTIINLKESYEYSKVGISLGYKF